MKINKEDIKNLDYVNINWMYDKIKEKNFSMSEAEIEQLTAYITANNYRLKRDNDNKIKSIYIINEGVYFYTEKKILELECPDCGCELFSISIKDEGYAKKLEEVENSIGEYYPIFFKCSNCGYKKEIYLGSD